MQLQGEPAPRNLLGMARGGAVRSEPGMPKPPERRSKVPVGMPLVDHRDYEIPLAEPKNKASPVDEVDEALAALQGFHPDALRVAREMEAAQASKKAALDAGARARRALARRAWAKRAAVVVSVAMGLWLAWTQYAHRAQRGRAIESALDPLLAPYLAKGFARVGGSRFGDESLAIETPEPSCFVAVASRAPGDGAVRVDRADGPLEGSATVAWCTCGAESGSVRVASPSAGGGVALLRTAIAQVGGQLALPFLDPAPATIAPPDDCAETSLDAWITSGAAVRVNDAALDEDLRDTLRRANFSMVASAPRRLPLAVVPGAAESCALAWSSSPTDHLSVRLAGGTRVVADATGAVGACTSRAVPFTVFRTGKGDLFVERVSALRVGGTHGLRQFAPRLGLSIVTAWVPDDDVDWDASAALRASGVLPTEITAPAASRSVRAARVVALSTVGATVTPDGPPDVGYACEPTLVTSPHTGSAVCVESTSLTWRVGGLGKAGVAAATFPFWMGALSSATDPRALAAELSLLRLGRRIVTDGFELASNDGVSESNGVTHVVGLGGRDGVIVLQLSGEAPWISPCSNGEVWTVDGDPAVVSLAPGQDVPLKCTPRAPKDHRTIVWRHIAPKR